jgi:hypothetical protein
MELVQTLNAGVLSFWSALKTFVSEFYQSLQATIENKLKTTTAEDMKESWALIREMIAAVFWQLHEARSACAGLAGTGGMLGSEVDEFDTAASYLWGALQGYKVQQEIAAKHIKRHSCVMPSLYLFLFNHRAPTSAVKRLEVACDDLTKDAKARQSQVDQVTAKVKKLELAGNRQPRNPGAS